MDLFDIGLGTNNSTYVYNNIPKPNTKPNTNKKPQVNAKQPAKNVEPVVSEEGSEGNQGGCVVDHDYKDAYSIDKGKKQLELPPAIKQACHGNPYLEGMIVGEILNAPRFKKRW
ncbi:MAG: hypothetical protein K5765_03830 [Clostridia bacterium]|nr:hypothetical protein [Clostridia bacterium]